jgi:hypothetical protein
MNRLLLIANYDYINTALSLSGIEDEVKTIKDKFELMQYKIQCNNMIPVPESELIKINVSAEPDMAYKTLLQKEINFVRKNEDTIIKKHINPVYNNRIHNRMNIGYVRLATPDFAMLEQKCDEWEEAHPILTE